MTAPAVVAPGAAAPEEARSRVRSPASATPAPRERGQLDRVPPPQPDQSTVPLTGVQAGGLEAVLAEWGTDGGAVVLTGRRPFVDLTARASFRPDGSLSGAVSVRASIGLFGMQLGEATWSVAGWEPSLPLASPHVALRGTALSVDLTSLPPEAVLTPAASLTTVRDGALATIELPGDALPEGQPLSPRMAELFHGLLGVDVSGLTVHPAAPVQDAPGFVSQRDLFFAPGIYGVDSPETLAVIDAAIRAALAGLTGPVGGAAPAAPAPEAPAPEGAGAGAPFVVPDAAAAPPPTPAVADVAPAVAAGGTLGDMPAPGEAAGAPGDGNAVDPAAAEGAGGGGGGGGGAAAPVEVLMPEAPTEPTPAAAARGGAVAGGAGGAARAATDLPDAQATTDGAHAAVTEPVAETAARAREELAAELGERPAPSPEIVALVERIRTAIRNNRPEDEDALLATDPTTQANEAGSTITGTVEGQVDDASTAYDDMSNPPAGSPALSPTPVVASDPSSPGMGVDAASAAPDPLPPENTSLDNDVAATDQRIADSGIDTRVTAEIPDGPFAEARAARGELGELAQRTPEEIHAEEQTAIDAAQGDMAQLQLQALAAMRTARGGTVGSVAEGQGTATSGEETTRRTISEQAQDLYDEAERSVGELLTPLSRTAIARWEAGLARLSRQFHDALARVQAWIDERHSGVVGTIVAIGDYVAGLPDWVTDEYNRAETEFGDGVSELLLGISSDVNGVLQAARAVVQTTRDQINGLFDEMEAEFPEQAAQERARFAGMLDGLDARVNDAETSFVRDVSARAITAINEAHAAVQAKRDEAGGLIGRVVAAINEFIDDPVKAIINGLLRLVGIPPGAFWALLAQIEQVAGDIAENPENFINNLVAGVKAGFQQFFDNFGLNLIKSFWQWLFSGMESPIPMPTSYDPMSLMQFALTLMGITWPNIREILVRHIGPTAVDVLEAAWNLLSVLITQGPQGIVNMIKEQLSPENIVGMILDAAINYLVETLIVQAAQYIFSLLNPAGAVAQAIRLIYQVCSWIFRNAARIFSFVQAVVGGIANVVAGNISGMAGVVERALVQMMVVAIDFLAGLLGLGGLPDEVAQVITQMQAYVLSIVERIIVFFVAQARALLAAMGIGGDEPEADDDNENNDDELGTTVRFSAAGESHRVWFQTSGADTTLMVASVPGPIENKISEWRGKISAGEPVDEALRAEASTTLGNLETVADQANEEGDRLAALFLQAAADENDQNEPPSDDALENRQRAVAGILDRLFTIFNEKPDPELLFATELGLVHPQARDAIVAALHAVTLPQHPTWASARSAAEGNATLAGIKSGPLNQSHAYGSGFAHDWAAMATTRALTRKQAGLASEPDADTRKAINKVLTSLGAQGGVGAAHGEEYLGRYKAQLHSHAAPFGTAPRQGAYDTAWQRSGQAGASSTIREAMEERITMPTSGPKGPDLDSKVRERVWQLLSQAQLMAPTGTTDVYIRIAPASMQTIQSYLQAEAADSGHGAAQQAVLSWWEAHVFQDEFHHAWPQWLGGDFEQTRIYIPRALHNFEGLTGFPGGFHQVFNTAFSAHFAAAITRGEIAINDAAAWELYATTNPSARAEVAALLVSAYKTVLSPFGAAGQQAITTFVTECRNTYPGTPSP